MSACLDKPYAEHTQSAPADEIRELTELTTLGAMFTRIEGMRVVRSNFIHAARALLAGLACYFAADPQGAPDPAWSAELCAYPDLASRNSRFAFRMRRERHLCIHASRHLCPPRVRLQRFHER